MKGRTCTNAKANCITYQFSPNKTLQPDFWCLAKSNEDIKDSEVTHWISVLVTKLQAQGPSTAFPQQVLKV